MAGIGTRVDEFEAVRRRGGAAYAAWLEAGYRECYSRGGMKSTPYLLQKRVRGAGGSTLYFVNVWAYDWSAYPGWTGPPVSLAAEAQFHTDAGATFDVELLHAESPAETGAFFARIYEAMGCTPCKAADG